MQLLPIHLLSPGEGGWRIIAPGPSSSSDSHFDVGAPPPALVVMVNVYVLVTSVKPLTSFLHDISVVTTNQEQRGQATEVEHLCLFVCLLVYCYSGCCYTHRVLPLSAPSLPAAAARSCRLPEGFGAGQGGHR